MAGDASEQSLQELIAEAKNISASLAKLSSVLGKTAQSGAKAAPSMDAAAKTINDLGAGMSKVLPLMGPAGVAIKVLTVAVEAVGKVFSMLGNLITGLFSGLTNAAGILGEFAMTLSKGNMQVSDLVGVMGRLAEQVPIVGGALSSLFGLFQMAIKRQEENLEIYRKISEVGGTLGGTLTQMRTDIRATGMTLEEYSNAVEKNSNTFAITSGSVDAGMKRFSKGMTELNNTNSEAGNKMRGLGLTTERMADAMSLYMLTQGTMNKRGLEDSARAASGAANLAEQVSYLSEVTGKRKDQIEAEIKEAAEEANWKNFLSGLDPAEAERATKLQAEAQIRGGKDLGDAMKLAIRTGITTPITEGGKKLFIATNGASEGILKSGADFVRNKNMTDAEGDKIMGLSYRKAGQQAVEQAKNFGIAGAVMDAQGRSLTNQNLLKIGINEKSFKTDEESIANRQKLNKQNADAATNDAAKLATQQQQLKNLGGQLDNLITKLVAPFIGPIMQLTDGFEKIIGNVITYIQPSIDMFSKWISKWVGTFSSDPPKTWEDFKKKLGLMWTEIKAEMGPRIKALWEEVKPVLIDAIKGVFGMIMSAVGDWIKNLILHPFGGSDKEDRANSPRSKAAAASTAKLDKNAKSSGSTPAPAGPDSAKLARDWAYSVMTNQNQEGDVPPNIKDQVTGIMKNDASLKQQAEAFKAESAKQADASKRKAAEDEANAKKASEQTNKQEATKTTELSPVATQELKTDPITMLNSNIERLIKTNQDVAENTKATVQAISSADNLFRRRG